MLNDLVVQLRTKFRVYVSSFRLFIKIIEHKPGIDLVEKAFLEFSSTTEP
jgi:hypothetical protein